MCVCVCVCVCVCALFGMKLILNSTKTLTVCFFQAFSLQSLRIVSSHVSQICGRCLTPYAVSCLVRYITYRALSCPRDAVYRSEADAKRRFFHFLTWKCVFLSLFINVVRTCIYSPQLRNLNAVYLFMFIVCVEKLTKIWERFLYRQSRSLRGHLAAHLLKLPKCQPTLMSTTRTKMSDYCL